MSTLMNEAVAAADRISNANPTWILALLCVLFFIGFIYAVRTVWWFYMREPTINDRGGMYHRYMAAHEEFMETMKTEVVMIRGHVRENQDTIKLMQAELGNVCKMDRTAHH